MSISSVGMMSGGNSAMSGASMRSSPSQRMTQLFNKIDSDQSGSITKDEFSSFLSSAKAPKSFQKQGLDQVWAQLDPNNTGSVNQDDFATAMASMMKQFRASHEASESSAQEAAETAARATMFMPQAKLDVYA